MFGFWSEIPYEELGDGVKRKILNSSGTLMMVEVTMDKGGVGKMHMHPHQQISYIVKGSVEFTIKDKKQVVGSGDSIYIASDFNHGAKALEDSVIVDIFTPIREDFLQK